MSGFYPHGKPGWFAYTQDFADNYGGETGYLAKANTKYPGLGSDRTNSDVINKALTNLQMLIDGARAAELAFLKDTGIDLSEGSNASDIFHHMNDILNSKQTFERGLKYMRQLQSKNAQGQKSETYREVSRYFGSYLNTAIQSVMNEQKLTAKKFATMNEDEVKKLINDIISKALTITYTKVQDFIDTNGNIRGKFGQYTKARKNETAQQAITDMINVIDKLKNNNAFSELGSLFKLDANSLQEWFSNRNLFKVRKGNKYNNAQVDSNYGGNALEVITSMVAAELGTTNIRKTSGDLSLQIVGQHTGTKNQMKADTLLFVGRGTINPDDYLQYVDNTTFGDRVRMQNVDAMEKYLNKLETNISHVIAISDKNYSIKASFDGITAQEKMNLQNVGLLLNQFKVGQVGELVNYLANCGDDMVQGAVDGQVRTALQTYIGYFLFDHLQIDTGKASNGPNVVNLLNVSGMYIPLSVYLEGIYKSLKEAFMTPGRFVSVSISLGGDTTAPSNWTADIWGSFRESHETETFIEYKILKGIADFISGL